MSGIVRAIKGVYDWFYYRPSTRVVQMYRAALGFIVLLSFFLYTPYLREFYTDAGFVSASAVQSIYPSFSVFFYVTDYWPVFALHILSLVAAACMALNIFPRLATALCYIFMLSYMNRFQFGSYGGIQVLVTTLFFSIFLPHTPPTYKLSTKPVEAWAFRMIQMHMALIYLSAALFKVATSNWFEGKAMSYILHSNLSIANFSFLSKHAWLAALITYSVLAIELAFIFLAWGKGTRRAMILLTMGMHVGIMFFLNVTYFSPIMIAILFCFLREEDYVDLKNLLKRRGKRAHATA